MDVLNDAGEHIGTIHVQELPHVQLYAACRRCGVRATRTARAPHGTEGKPGQGRPMGFLGCWLLAHCEGPKAHKELGDPWVNGECFPQRDRRNARRALRGMPSYNDVAGRERSPSGPDSEPEMFW